MVRFVGKRLFYLVPVLLAVTLLTFLISSLLPGDLAYTILGDQATPENVAALRAQMGLDLPIWQRYGLWLWQAVQGDLGRSFRTGEVVFAAVTERLPLLTAHRMASGMPISRPITSAITISSSEIGSRSVTAASTTSPVRNERPRSPCNTPHSQCRKRS